MPISFLVLVAIFVTPVILLMFQGKSKDERWLRFDRESMRQFNRLMLNFNRNKEGKDSLPSPEIIEMRIGQEALARETMPHLERLARDTSGTPPEEAKRILKSLDLWPEAPPGEGGIWYNSPVYRSRNPSHGGGNEKVVDSKYYMLENMKWFQANRR